MKKIILARTSFLLMKKLKLVSLQTLSMKTLSLLWNKWLLSGLVIVLISDGLALRTRKLEQRKFSSWISDRKSQPEACLHPHSLKLANHQFYKNFNFVLANSGGQFSGLQELFQMINIQKKTFLEWRVRIKYFFKKKIVFAPKKKSHFKVKKILEDSLDLIPSPSPSVKIQIMGGKVGLRCKGKTLLGIVNNLFCTTSLLTTPSNVWPNK